VASKPSLRNRIVGHRKIKASELKHHPLNWREHPKGQQQVLQAIIKEVGFARSLLCYVSETDKELYLGPDHTATTPDAKLPLLTQRPEPPLTLIDGHLRANLNPDEILDVEVLDVTDDEARKLLLTLDPLVELAKPNQEMLRNLNAITTTEEKYLSDLWNKVSNAQKMTSDSLSNSSRLFENQYLVLITCNNEHHQLELLEEMKSRGFTVKAVIG